MEQVIELCQAGLSEELLIAAIRKNSQAFDLSATQLLQLKKAGVTDNTILVMMDPKAQPKSPDSSPAVQAQPAPTSSSIEAPANTVESPHLSPNLPSRIGIFYQDRDKYIEIPSIEVEGKRGKSGFLTGGLTGFKTSYKAPGKSSKTVIAANSLSIVAHMPGRDISQLRLISILESGKDRLLFYMSGRVSSSLKINQIQTSPKDLGNGYVEILPASPLPIGEYAIVDFEAGSASAFASSPPAKVWDFSIAGR